MKIEREKFENDKIDNEIIKQYEEKLKTKEKRLEIEKKQVEESRAKLAIKEKRVTARGEYLQKLVDS